MAISGGFLFLFVVSHLLGNLQIFLGPEAINRYAAFLRSTGELIWVARIGLLAMAVLHVVTAVSLTLENRAARLTDYQSKRYIAASYASRTMHLSGVIVLVYLVYHLLHFTLLKIHPELAQGVDAQGRHDVYRMVVSSFQRPGIALWYIAANVLLGAHLSHGLYSALQSLGGVRENLRPHVRAAAHVIGYGIALGYVSIPAAVWMGIVK